MIARLFYLLYLLARSWIKLPMGATMDFKQRPHRRNDLW